jgi:hypothetical protein
MKTLIRLHQVLLVLAILSGCYSPELRDCTVTCGGSDECASDQVCTKGLCAAEGVSCGPGGNSATDAGIDAGARVTVHVMIEGSGRVELQGAGVCGVGGDRDCDISVARGAVTAPASAADGGHPFALWGSPAGNDQPATCMFTANSPVTVKAKFK